MIRKLLYILFFLLIALPCWAFDAGVLNCDDGDSSTWCVPVNAGSVTIDGDTYCSGSCDPGDTIYLEAGVHGNIRFQDLDGSSSNWITITNEDSATRVRLASSSERTGILQLRTCSYVDLRGDGYSGHSWSAGSTSSSAYGIAIYRDGSPSGSNPGNSVRIEGNPVIGNTKSHHLRVRYIEMYTTDLKGKCVSIGDLFKTDATVFNDIEIDHNYCHDTGYSGFYLGHNYPAGETADEECSGDNGGDDSCPYVSTISVHHNLFEDIGSYAMTLKGVYPNSVNSIYNNIIRPSTGSGHYSTAHVKAEDRRVNHGQTGINLSWFYNNAYARVYNNLIVKTTAAGMKISEANHLVYNNVILGAGVGYTAYKPSHLESNNDCVGLNNPYSCCEAGTKQGDCWDYTKWAHGIFVDRNNTPEGKGIEKPTIYNNTIVKPARYGISDVEGDKSGEYPLGTIKDNLITEAGLGEWHTDGVMTEGSGAYANTYVSDTDNAQFTTWSDDNNYTNDNFLITTSSAAYNASGASDYPPTDFVGTTRPVAFIADDGSYEAVGVVSSYTLSLDGDGRTNFDGSTDCGGPCSGGDVITLLSGTTNDMLYFENLQGSSGNPIIIRNTSGVQTVIDKNMDGTNQYGIWIQNSKYVKIDGSNGFDESDEDNLTYGIRITDVDAAGIFMNQDVSEIEIQYVQIDNIDMPYGDTGVGIKENNKISDVNVATDEILNGLVIHHNYIYNTGQEGMFLGGSGSCDSVSLLSCCDSKDDTDDAIRWTGVEIYKNRTNNTGWGGISTSCGGDAIVRDNVIMNAGLDDYTGAGKGMCLALDKGFGGSAYRNLIVGCQKEGIGIQHTRAVDIYNNVIADVGKYSGVNSNRVGIDESGGSVNDYAYLVIRYNTIVNVPEGAIDVSTSQTGVIQDNLYVNIGAPSALGALIVTSFGHTAASAAFCNFEDAGNNNYDLTRSTPVVIRDAGQDNGYTMSSDFEQRPRPYNLVADIGAYEYIDDCEAVPGGGDYCDLCGPCDVGEGDCDSDGDCVAGLVCIQVVGIDVCGFDAGGGGGGNTIEPGGSFSVEPGGSNTIVVY